MTAQPLPLSALLAAACFLGGIVLGIGYFALMRRTVLLFVAGRQRAIAAALTLLRLLGVLGVLALVARLGPLPLLACFAGFLAARGRAIRAEKRRA